MSETNATSSSTSSSVKKRTLSDAGLDTNAEGEHSNNGKRVVVFEAFKLFDVQSAVSFSFQMSNIENFDIVVFSFLRNNWTRNCC